MSVQHGCEERGPDTAPSCHTMHIEFFLCHEECDTAMLLHVATKCNWQDFVAKKHVFFSSIQFLRLNFVARLYWRILGAGMHSVIEGRTNFIL